MYWFNGTTNFKTLLPGSQRSVSFMNGAVRKFKVPAKVTTKRHHVIHSIRPLIGPN